MIKKIFFILCIYLFTFSCGDDKEEKEERSTYEGTNLSFTNPDSSIATIHFDGIDAKTLYELMLIEPSLISSTPRTIGKQGYKVSCFNIKENYRCSLDFNYRTGKVLSATKTIRWMTDNSVDDLSKSYYGENIVLIYPKSSVIFSFVQILGEDAKTLYHSFTAEEFDLPNSEKIVKDSSTFLKTGEDILCLKNISHRKNLTTYECKIYLAYRTGFVYALD